MCIFLRQEDSDMLGSYLERDSFLNVSYNRNIDKTVSKKERFLIGDKLNFKREKLLEKIGKKPRMLTLFKISKLGLNYVPKRVKSKIRVEAGLLLDEEQGSIFKQKAIKRAQRFYLTRMKSIK
jgi:hypothetical protein